MKITIEATSKIVHINNVPARVWEGETISGTPVMAVICLMQPQTTEPGRIAEFERELKATKGPRSEGAQALDLRMVL
ncbi:MAG TPA: hypothetical protein VHT00_14065 [Stellaceae bacterium]|jgi:hypothetical protein|nr:hypothetical protein [Stellaceae bacterium]